MQIYLDAILDGWYVKKSGFGTRGMPKIRVSVPQRICIASIHNAIQFSEMKDHTIVPVLQLPACLNPIQKNHSYFGGGCLRFYQE